MFCRARKVCQGVDKGDHCETSRAIFGVKGVIEQCYKALFVKQDDNKWHTQLFNDKGKVNGNKIRTYRLFKNGCYTEAFLTDNIPKVYRRTLSFLRSGNLPLEIETGRYSNVTLQERICKLCNSNVIEDEIHFTVDCQLYDDIRDSLIDKVHQINCNFKEYNSKNKCLFLMTCEAGFNSVGKPFIVCLTGDRFL